MIEAQEVYCSYGNVPVLKGVSLRVGQDEIVSIVGSNGAGKTTLLKAISGLLRPRSGRVLCQGQDITLLSPPRIVRLGVCQVPEGRQLFGSLSVWDNLLLGSYAGYRQRGLPAVQKDIEDVFELFPRLRERAGQRASSLSGGEQQMLTIGRALMSRPRALLLDEPSLGLAPLMVAEILRVVQDLHGRGIPILMVEQNVSAALSISHRGYVMEAGRIVLEGPGKELALDEGVKKAYLGYS